jgi:predicted Zn-dependent peptidase
MPEQLDTCLAVLNDIITDVCQDVSIDLIERAKRQLTVQFRMGMDAVEGSMLQLGALLDDKFIYSPLEWVDKVNAVQPKQVQAFLSECLQADVLQTIASPNKKA